MAKRVPTRRLYHENWKRGFIQNSPHGNDIAKGEHRNWLDNDFHLSADLVWVNMHGAPEEVWGPGKPETWTWATLSKRRHRSGGRLYQLRDFAHAIADAHKRGQGMEAEVKDLRPIPLFVQDSKVLRECLTRWVSHAERVWGAKWQQHLNLKIVSTMAGGWDAYGSKVCAVAHELGIPTLVTVRGKDRYRRKPWPPCVTYVRGQVTPVR